VVGAIVRIPRGGATLVELIASTVFKPAPIAVSCAMTIANRLLAVAQEFCPDAVPQIRAAIAQGME
jgi:hypothetical protein